MSAYQRAQAVADYMVFVGTGETLTGDYHFDFCELPEPSEFISRHKQTIIDSLLNHAEVADADICYKDFEVIFGFHTARSMSRRSNGKSRLNRKIIIKEEKQ